MGVKGLTTGKSSDTSATTMVMVKPEQNDAIWNSLA